MPDKHLTSDPASFWIWNAVFAGFFTWVRAFIKQEFRNPLLMMATGMISLGCALFAGYIADELGASEWVVRLIVAAGALLSYDVMRSIIHFGSQIDGNTVWNVIKVYAGIKNITVPEEMPTKVKSEPVEKSEN